MTIEQTQVVDMIAIINGEAHLVAADHLNWESDFQKHCYLIQEKFNSYLSFIESGELLRARPDLDSKSLVLHLILLHEPSPDGLIFLDKLKNAMNQENFKFIFEVGK